MSRNIHIVLGVMAAIVAYVAWILFQPDEALTPALRDTTASAVPRHVSETTIGLLGLEAPAGTDFMEHGRLVLAEAARTGGYAMDAETFLNQGKPRLETKYPENLECWLFGPGEQMSDEMSRNCASPVQLQAALDVNAELLQRYRMIQKLPVTADGESFRGSPTINLGKLSVADIANDLRLGQAERAYRKWADNQLHQSRMAGYGGSWVMTAINLVNEGLSYTSLELMLAKAPQLMQLHREELLGLIKPRGDTTGDIAAIMRGEIRVFEQIRADLPFRRFVRANRLRNRFAAYSSDFVDAVAANLATLPAAIAGVNVRHSAWRMGDNFDPITAATWQLLMNGQLKQGELILSMFRKEAQRRLYTIKVMRATAKAPDASIEADLKAAPRELRSPFDGTPAQWDAGTRKLYFDVAGGTGRVQVSM